LPGVILFTVTPETDLRYAPIGVNIHLLDLALFYLLQKITVGELLLLGLFLG
jgi:hypothetical protein